MGAARRLALVRSWTIHQALPGLEKLDLESLSSYTLPRHNVSNPIVWACSIAQEGQVV
jgi:hypothetical protein